VKVVVLAKRSKTESAESKVKSAVALGALGGSIAGPIGAGVGAVTGLIIGDDTTVFPIDMVAIPAYQAYMVSSQPAFTVYIKAGETLVPTGGNVKDMEENPIAEALSDVVLEKDVMKRNRKRSKWNVYTSKKKNQIRFKSGKKKGLLNLKAMGKAYRKANKGGKK